MTRPTAADRRAATIFDALGDPTRVRLLSMIAALALFLREVHLALSTLRFARGMRDYPHPSPEEARAFEWDEEATNVVRAFGARGFIGTEEELPERLLAAARESQADELMLMSNCHDHAARKESYTRLARAFGLVQ